jgi:hypothetical protein
MRGAGFCPRLYRLAAHNITHTGHYFDEKVPKAAQGRKNCDAVSPQFRRNCDTGVAGLHHRAVAR